MEPVEWAYWVSRELPDEHVDEGVDGEEPTRRRLRADELQADLPPHEGEVVDATGLSQTARTMP